MDLDKTVNDLVKRESEMIGVLENVVSYLEYTSHRFAHLEGHVAELANRPPVTVKVPKNSKFFFLTACIASGYVGYKLADRRVQERIKQALADARQEVIDVQKPKTTYAPTVN